MDTNQKIENFTEKYKTANDREKVILDAKIKELKEKPAKTHKHTAGIRSYRTGMIFVFVCACGEEIGRDLLSKRN